MKALQIAALTSLLLGSASALADPPIINFSVGQEIAPGVYGQVQFSNGAPPPLVAPQPTIIVAPPPNVVVQPIYLHVPPEHQRDWARHCHEYNACGRPVYFVRSREYDPDYHHDRGRHRGEERRDEERRDEGRGEERRDEGRGEERRGEGRGEGRGD